MPTPAALAQESNPRLVWEVFLAFLKLGVTSFGGPIAHLGYFHRELIERRRWLDEAHYAHLLALCQLLPGPASSQLGFAMGTIRAGWMGGFAAFIAFTLPSALLLLGFARILPMLETSVGHAAIHGLKLLAVAVVGQGLLLMVKRLTPDVPRALIAVAACAFIVLTAGAGTQLLVIGISAVLGLVLCRHVDRAPAETFPVRYGTITGGALIGVFLALLAATFAVGRLDSPAVTVAAAFYRVGALVFGGGHVVLPLLQEAVVAPGWVSSSEFLAGYGAAQAVPGPMFSIAAFLGARLQDGEGGIAGASVSLLAIFLPGLLLVAGALPLWKLVARSTGAMSAFAGVNAAVVGLLAAALYDPLWISAVHAPADVLIVVTSFAILAATRVSILAVLALCVAASVVPVLINSPGG